MKPFKKYVSLLCLVLACFFFSLFLAEVYARIFLPYSRDYDIPGGLFGIGTHLGWKLNAGKSVTHQAGMDGSSKARVKKC